jgi:ubiquinone biosynthesis protein
MMVNWNFLIDEAAIASVLPDEYGCFRRPIAGALAVFLEGLPAAHQSAILAEQASLPPTASASKRLATLARICPALHKLGQILARDRRLSAELRQHLQELESLPPSISLETIQDILAQEVGPLERLGVALTPPALAEASVAVVIPFRYDCGPDPAGARHGVFKILKPGIAERLEQELELFERVGWYLDERCDDFGIPHLDYRDAFEQVRDKLQHEYRLDLEQRHLVQARAIYEGEHRVQIPALLDPCTPRVTAMERVWGGKVTERHLDSAVESHRVARLVVEAMIARPIFGKADLALFHGDPHAGNLFLTPDSRLAILDWSLVGTLGERERIALVQITLAALTLDSERLSMLLDGLSEQPVYQPGLEVVIHARLELIRQGQFPGFTWLMGLLEDAVARARLRVGADLLLFRKALHTLDGVLADIHEGDSWIDQVLLSEFFGHLAIEWPGRWLAPPNSRAFSTRLSNSDLVQFVLRSPLAVARFWNQESGVRNQETGLLIPDCSHDCPPFRSFQAPAVPWSGTCSSTPRLMTR